MMIKKRILTFICLLAILLTVVPCYAENIGVSDLRCTRGTNKVTLNWTNPDEFDNNILYVKKNGVDESPIDLGNVSSYVYQPVTDGDSFIFTLRTVYADTTYTEDSEKYFARYNDRTSLSGWTISVFSDPDFGASTANAKNGNYSVYFNCENPLEDSSTYYRLTKTASLSSDKKYRISFWFKTEGYEDGSSFTYDELSTSTKPELVAGVDFMNGGWNYVEQFYDSTASSSKNITVTLNAKGKIYFDDFKCEQIDDEGNVLNSVFDEGFERDIGVKDLSATRDGNVGTISWKNPTDNDFLYNEVYKIYNNKTTFLARVEKNEEKYLADVTAGGRYVFIVKSYYEGEVSIEAQVKLFRDYMDTETFPGWSCEIRDEDAVFGISNDEKHNGKYSAFFKFNHDIQANKYVVLSRNVSLEANKRYCFSYWFKSKDYASGRGRFVVFDHAIGDRTAVNGVGTSYVDGEWHNVKFYYDSNTAATKAIQIWVEALGTIWFDDIEVYAVDDNGEKIGDNLVTGSDKNTDGGFESEAFSKRPVTPEQVSVKNKFRGAEISWKADDNADKVRIYEGETLIKETDYLTGSATIDGLSYGLHVLDICNVSLHGVESDRLPISVNTLAYNVSDVRFSQTNVLPGTLSAEIDVANDGRDPLNVAFMIALYDGKKLEKLEYIKEVINQGIEKPNITLSINIPTSISSDYSVVAYVWDDLLEASKAYKSAAMIE